MSVITAIHPHQSCKGLESPSSKSKDGNRIAAILKNFPLDFFLSSNLKTSPAAAQSPNMSKRINSFQKEKPCLTFSPFEGTWDYSEVD